MSHGVGILKTAPSALPPIPLSLNDPQFQGFGGETTSIQLRPILRGYPTLLLGKPFKTSADRIMKRIDVNGSS